TRRYQCERQMREEEPETKNASDKDRNSEPCAIEKPVEGATVAGDHAFDKIAGISFHPGALVTGFALPKNPRTHQRRERQGRKTRGEDGHNDRNREFAKYAAEQSRDENQRN